MNQYTRLALLHGKISLFDEEDEVDFVENKWLILRKDREFERIFQDMKISPASVLLVQWCGDESQRGYPAFMRVISENEFYWPEYRGNGTFQFERIWR